MGAPKKPHPWLVFLAARAAVIDWMWDDEENPRTFGEIAETLTMDKEQVASIRLRDRSLDLPGFSDASAEIPDLATPMPIEALAAYLPADVSWGEPITPAIVRHILDKTVAPSGKS